MAEINLKRKKEDCYKLSMPPYVRQVLGAVVKEFSESVDPDYPDSARLFPTAYPNNPEEEESYRVLGHMELVDQKVMNRKIFADTIDADELTGDEVRAWMRCINDCRLILGTELDLSEETHINEDNDSHLLYESLSQILSIFTDTMISDLD